MSNKTVYEDEDFEVILENQDEILFLHCYVDAFSVGVFKRMREVLKELFIACMAHGWEEIYSYTPNPKFGKMFGGAKIDEFQCSGETYEVLRWELVQ